jgi:hypothetical protein
VRIDEFSFRFGKEIIASRPETFASILAAVVNAQEAYLRRPKISIAAHLVREFSGEGWPKCGKSEPSFSFLKDRVAIEIEFSRCEFLSRDYLRFLSAYNSDKIDVGVLITHSEAGLARVKYKAVAPSIIRVKADLAWLRGTITVPIWVIALK